MILQAGTQAIETFVESILGVVPQVLSGLAFLALAYLGVKLLLVAVRASLSRVYPEEQTLIVDLAVLLVSVFLWFAVSLTFLKIIGMGEIAASIGTATGFVALGVSYALSNMIEDTVAGVYLLRDPDFNIGDQVTTASVSGTVAAIGIRKSRIDTADGDRVVVSNRQIESRWAQVDPAET